MEQGNFYNNPQAEILALQQQAMVEGAVDSETQDYNDILDKLRNHEISPGEALKDAHNIADKRQNYH
jgi:hypothetical protein